MNTLVHTGTSPWDAVYVVDDTSRPVLGERVHVPASLHTEMASLMRMGAQYGLPLRLAQYAPIPSGPQLYRGESTEVVVISAADDPLFTDPDGFPMPKKNLDDLRRIQAAGIQFDDIWVAHELPLGTVQRGSPLTAEMLAPPTSRQAAETSHRLGKVGGMLWKMAAFPLLIAGGLAVAAAAPVAAIGLDPIIFGLRVTPGRRAVVGEAAAWVMLTAWAWNEEV